MTDAFLPPPIYSDSPDFYGGLTEWVHAVVDGGQGLPRQIDVVVFEPQTGRPARIRLDDGSEIDCLARTILDGAELARYHEALMTHPLRRTGAGGHIRLMDAGVSKEALARMLHQATQLRPQPRPFLHSSSAQLEG